MSKYFSFVDLILLNRDEVEHNAFIIWGYRGMGKTTCLRGIYKQILDHNKKNPDNEISTIFATDIDDVGLCDCLFLDDFGTKFGKRDAMTIENKEFMKALQEVRTNIPLIISSSPSYKLPDKDFRMFFSPAQILFKSEYGYIVNAIGNYIVPKPNDEELREFRQMELIQRKNRFLNHMDRIKMAHAKKKASA